MAGNPRANSSEETATTTTTVADDTTTTTTTVASDETTTTTTTESETTTTTTTDLLDTEPAATTTTTTTFDGEPGTGPAAGEAGLKKVTDAGRDQAISNDNSPIHGADTPDDTLENREAAIEGGKADALANHSAAEAQAARDSENA